MTFTVKNPLTKTEAKQILSVVGDSVFPDHRFVSDGEDWKPEVRDFDSRSLVLAKNVSPKIDTFGLIQPYVACRHYRLAVVVGRTYSEELGKSGPYMVAFKDGTHGYAEASDLMGVRLDFLKYILEAE